MRVSKRGPEPTVGALVVRRDGKILLVRSHKWRDKYSVPGGHIENGERAEVAIAREVLEETGIRICGVQLAMVQQAIYSPEFIEKRHFIFLDFFCKAETERITLDGVELQEHEWVGPSEALSKDLESYTRNLVSHYIAVLRSQGTSGKLGPQGVGDATQRAGGAPPSLGL